MQIRPRINSEEWMVIVALFMLMASITYLTHEHWVSSDLGVKVILGETPMNSLTVMVEGAVEYPGKKSVQKGALLKDVIALSMPIENADLQDLPMERKVKDGERIQIPVKEYITVHIKGAVNIPGAVIVKKGSTVSDLIKLVSLKDNADLTKLKMLKKLKEGDVINVRVKK